MYSVSQGIFTENLSLKRDGDFDILRESQNHPMESSEEQVRALAEYVRKAMMEDGLSVYAVEKEIRRRRGTMGKSTVDQILQGKIKNPGIYTLRQLSWGIFRPLDDILDIALGRASGEATGFTKSELGNIYELGKTLPLPEQRMFKRFIKMLVNEMQRVLGGQ